MKEKSKLTKALREEKSPTGSFSGKKLIEVRSGTAC